MTRFGYFHFHFREMATLCDSSDSDEVEQQQKINSARAVKLALELHALGLGGAGAQNGAGGEMDSDEDEDLSALAPPKRSQNTTEIITVPSSEHVAEIVGKQGSPTFIGLILTINQDAKSSCSGRRQIRTLKHPAVAIIPSLLLQVMIIRHLNRV